MGYGVVLESGRNLSFHFSDIYQLEHQFRDGSRRRVGIVSMAMGGSRLDVLAGRPDALIYAGSQVGCANSNHADAVLTLLPVIPDGTVRRR